MVLTDIVLNDQQQASVDKLVYWWNWWVSGAPPFIWQGYAGTGKTTSIRQALEALEIPLERVALITPTNRAAKVATEHSGIKAHTLHSLMFKTVVEELDYHIELLNDWEDSVSFPNAPRAKITTDEYAQQYIYTCEIVLGETAWYYDGNLLPEDNETRIEIFNRLKEKKIRELKNKILELREKNFILIPKEPEDIIAAYDIIVADEASMISVEIAADLDKIGLPIVYTGDPFQIPPVNAQCFWEGRGVDAMLTQVMRQTGDGAGIPLAGQEIRQGRRPKQGQGMNIYDRNQSSEFYSRGDIILAGTHRTRKRINEEMRRFWGYKDVYPQVGEKVVSFSNYRKLNITNGEVYTVKEVKGVLGKKIYLDLIDPFGNVIEDVPCWERIFQDEDYMSFTDQTAVQMTFGYCITVHKAQGSEWDHVIVCDDWSKSSPIYQRWLYTAITRASNRCDLVS